jgi:sulfite reductase (NADPH) flavoprotein alpha-component
MFKSLLFQLHWLLGITAGTVLALMGLTGATLSFEDELVHAANPVYASMAQRQAAGERILPLDALMTRLRQDGDVAVSRIQLVPDGGRPSLIRFDGADKNTRYFDPYTGQRMVEPRGAGFFHLMEDLHRRLAAGERGKAITGACVITLVFFCLSGLYLRWPRHWTDWRTWLAVEWKRSGRSFLWSLHSVIGTWCMLVYLVTALTGLWWSYDWYRDGVTQLLGGEPREAPRSERANVGPRFDALNLAPLQAAVANVPELRGQAMDLRFGKAGQPVTVRYLGADAAHVRAFDTLKIDLRSGALLKRTQFSAQAAGRQLLGSIYALHTGSYFGLPGRVVVMLASLCMSLFFVTGWMLYLDRRRKKRDVRASRGALVPQTATAGEPWLVGFASQSGFAEQLAWRAAGQLQAAGMPVQVQSLAQLDGNTLRNTRKALFVVSTFGDGEPPDSARAFERRVLSTAQALPDLGYALLALGDRQYARFCGFSRRVEQWLGQQGARTLFPSVEMDGHDTDALERWQQQLATLTGIAPVAPAQVEAALQPWTLGERVLLNPGSAGAPVWRIALLPPPEMSWEAGDILEIAPCNASADVLAVLARDGLDPQDSVQVDGVAMPLQLAAATRELPAAGDPPLSAQAWLDALPPLSRREYSIASLPQDGVLELIVRQTLRHDGRAGLGSGWLILHAQPGAPVMARVRANPGFRRAAMDAPMILIGNGTGIAGLRSLIKDAARTGHHGHWLLFGERNGAHDHFCAQDMRDWHADGHLQRLDLAFSRDQDHKVYVQHHLAEAAADLRDWIARGAVIHVCGSLAGMARGVDEALRQALGEDAVDALAAEGRYRRDVY